MNRSKLMLGLLLSASLGATSAIAQDDDYTIRLVAGSPGYDHIQPFMAEYMDIWENYGLNVDFMGGNYMRSNQMMSIGDFDVGYNQYASAIRFNAAGIENLIVAASSANCALIVAHEDVNSWEDLKGKRFGIVTQYDVQYFTLVNHILPRHGLDASDVNFATVPVPEVGNALITGDIAAAFPFEPFGTNALGQGAKLLLGASDMVDQSEIPSDMLRNGLVFNKEFAENHPELAKRIVWAHLDAVHLMREDREIGIEVLEHYNPGMDPALLADSYDNCGWSYDAPPREWIETLLTWMDEADLLQNGVDYDSIVDLSWAESYPGYPGWEHLDD